MLGNDEAVAQPTLGLELCNTWIWITRSDTHGAKISDDSMQSMGYELVAARIADQAEIAERILEVGEGASVAPWRQQPAVSTCSKSLLSNS